MTDTVQLASPRSSQSVVSAPRRLSKSLGWGVSSLKASSWLSTRPTCKRTQTRVRWTCVERTHAPSARRVRTFAPRVVAGAMGGSVVSGFFQIEAIAFDPGSTDHNLHDAKEKP